jgi:hypothetical protein
VNRVKVVTGTWPVRDPADRKDHKESHRLLNTSPRGRLEVGNEQQPKRRMTMTKKDEGKGTKTTKKWISTTLRQGEQMEKL